VGERAAAAWVLAALLGASLEPILVKLGYRAAATPWQLLALKNLVAAAVIVPLARAPRWPGLAGVARIGRVSVLLIVTNALSLLALTRLPAVTQMTVVATTPAAVALVARARGRVRPGWRFWAALAAALVGMLLTLDVLRPGALAFDALGLALAFGAVGSSTLYRSAMEDLTAAFGPPVVSTWVFLINAAVTSALVLPWSGLPPRAALPMALWIGLAAAVANAAFLVALHRVGATRLSVFTLLQRPFVMLAAALVLAEPLRASQGVGVAVVLVSVHLAQRASKKEDPR
jgi:drug/metabolite transporter (DMT)-like permease